MPGHIGEKGFTVPELKCLAGIDLTEVPGIDDLHLPAGDIKEAKILLAQAYGARESFFLVNGATSGIHALFMSLGPPGSKVLLPRNSHRSFFGGMVLAGTSPVYIPCRIEPELGIALSVCYDDIENLLNFHQDSKAVFITSPSYFGTTCDIEKISIATRVIDTLLLVDEAHGGHFPFHSRYPRPALSSGADAVVNGLHKTLPVLNQGACLHAGSGFKNLERLASVCSLLTTTSPSFPILASIDLARELMVEQGEVLLERALMLSREYKRKIGDIEGLRCYDAEELRRVKGVKDVDPLKLLIAPNGLSVNGVELARLLRDAFKIQVEIEQDRYILAMMSMFHERDDWERLYLALKNIAATYSGQEKKREIIEAAPYPVMQLLPREAFYADSRRISFEDCRGLIAAEMVAVYPPGVPCLLPGELITPEIFSYLQYLKKTRARLQGPGDVSLNYIRVIA